MSANTKLRRGHAFWESVAAEMNARGESQAAAASRLGVSPKMLQKWLRRLRREREATRAKPVRVLPVTMTASPPARGQKNFLSVGREAAGRNLATLHTLVASCEAQGKNPWAYRTDVLRRLDAHPASRIDELLPDRWQPATETTASSAAA